MVYLRASCMWEAVDSSPGWVIWCHVVLGHTSHLSLSLSSSVPNPACPKVLFSYLVLDMNVIAEQETTGRQTQTSGQLAHCGFLVFAEKRAEGSKADEPCRVSWTIRHSSPALCLSLWAWCVYHISNLTQEDWPRLVRAADGGSPPLESGYCRQLTSEAAVNKVLTHPLLFFELRARNPLNSSVWRCWSKKQRDSENQHIKSGSALTVLPSYLTMSALGQLENMKRPQDASWNMFSINPQLVAVTAKLENIEVKLSSFFKKLKLFEFQSCEHLGWLGR